MLESEIQKNTSGFLHSRIFNSFLLWIVFGNLIPTLILNYVELLSLQLPVTLYVWVKILEAVHCTGKFRHISSARTCVQPGRLEQEGTVRFEVQEWCCFWEGLIHAYWRRYN